MKNKKIIIGIISSVVLITLVIILVFMLPVSPFVEFGSNLHDTVVTKATISENYTVIEYNNETYKSIKIKHRDIPNLPSFSEEMISAYVEDESFLENLFTGNYISLSKDGLYVKLYSDYPVESIYYIKQ